METLIRVNIQNEGPEIIADITDNNVAIDIKVEGEGPPGKTPQKGVDYWTEEDKQEIVDEVLSEIPGGTTFEIGNGLKLENNILSVDTVDDAEQDNTLPITSAGVFSIVGNIDVLLATI